MKWGWSGLGMGPQWNGDGVVWKWDHNEMGMEWSGNGTTMKWGWSGLGMGPHNEMGWSGLGMGPCVMEWSGNGLGTMQLNGSALEMRLYTVDRTIYNITVF